MVHERARAKFRRDFAAVTFDPSAAAISCRGALRVAVSWTIFRDARRFHHGILGAPP